MFYLVFARHIGHMECVDLVLGITVNILPLRHSLSTEIRRVEQGKMVQEMTIGNYLPSFVLAFPELELVGTQALTKCLVTFCLQ